MKRAIEMQNIYYFFTYNSPVRYAYALQIHIDIYYPEIFAVSVAGLISVQVRF